MFGIMVGFSDHEVSCWRIILFRTHQYIYSCWDRKTYHDTLWNSGTIMGHMKVWHDFATLIGICRR